MIRSWRNAASRRVWEGETPNRFRGLDVAAAIDLLLALNAADTLRDLSPLKSVGLHKLKGTRASQWATCLSMKLSKAAETQRMSHRGFQSLCHIRVRTVQLPPTSL